MGTFVLWGVHLVSMSFREEVALVEEIVLMATEDKSQPAGAKAISVIMI